MVLSLIFFFSFLASTYLISSGTFATKSLFFFQLLAVNLLPLPKGAVAGFKHALDGGAVHYTLTDQAAEDLRLIYRLVGGGDKEMTITMQTVPPQFRLNRQEPWREWNKAALMVLFYRSDYSEGRPSWWLLTSCHHSCVCAMTPACLINRYPVSARFPALLLPLTPRSNTTKMLLHSR